MEKGIPVTRRGGAFVINLEVKEAKGVSEDDFITPPPKKTVKWNQGVQPMECDLCDDGLNQWNHLAEGCPTTSICQRRVWVSNDIQTVSPKDEEGQEDMVGRGVRAQATSYKPSAKEKEEHEQSHIPLRWWCEICVMGRAQVHQIGALTRRNKIRSQPCLTTMQRRRSRKAKRKKSKSGQS